jgi:Bacterial protein of unknown function (DUF922)
MDIAPYLLVASAAVVCVPSTSPAQAPRASPVIEWSAARKLSRDDFKGQVPKTASFQSRSWIRIEASWRCISGSLNTTITAVFDPSRSWWLGSQWNPWEDVDSRRKWISRSRADIENKRHLALSDADLLRHEQLHFDLAELTAAKIRQRLSALPDVCAAPDRDAHVENIVTELTAAFGEEQVAYDDDTAHGTKPQPQQNWESRVERAFHGRRSR